MTNAGIEAFLIVCKQHSISKAAELFISQSSLSIRLRTLEKEVGCPLFFRHKGSREMVLTEEGKRFYQLSLQYQDIVRSMLAIGNRKSSLRLSALNSVSTYLLPPVYEQFMRDHPDIHLEIQDMTVEAACQSLLRGETDLGVHLGRAPHRRHTGGAGDGGTYGPHLRGRLLLFRRHRGRTSCPPGRRCTWSGPTSLPAGIRSYGAWTRCPGSSWRS